MLQKETVIQRNNQTNSSSPNSPSPLPISFIDEQGIDLRKYVGDIIRQWKVVVGSALLFGVLALLLSFLQPASYVAEAGVTLLNIHSEVVFDPEFTTVPIELVATQQDKRSTALQALAESPSLLSTVYSHLQPQLTNSAPTALSDAVEAQLRGDFLRLQVYWDNPEDATLIANTWAQQYVETANRAYVSTSSNTPDEARQAAQEAFANYQTIQKEYERVIAESKLAQLEGQIAELDALINTLRGLKTEALVLLNSTSVSANTKLVKATSETLEYAIEQSVRRETVARAQELQRWYERRYALRTLRETLEDIKAALQAGNPMSAAASGDFLAVMIARAGLIQEVETAAEGTTSSSNPAQLQLQIDLGEIVASGNGLTIEEVDSLLQASSESLSRADQEIERLSEEMFLGEGLDTPSAIPQEHVLLTLVDAQVEEILNISATSALASSDLSQKPLEESLIQLSEQRQALRAEKEAAAARELELTRSRDAAWSLYTTLDNKALEAEAQFATGAPQVRLAIPATTPTEPQASGRIISILGGTILGALLAALYILARELVRGITAATPAGVPLRDVQATGD